MPASKTARWLDLIAYLLQHRFAVTRDQVFQSVAGYREDLEEGDLRAEETVRRKFERDKDELRALGIHIESVPLPGTAGDESSVGYRLKERDFYLPYLQLEDSATRSDRPYQGVRIVRIAREDLEVLDRATGRLAGHTDYPLAHAARSARRKLAFDLPIPLARIERVLAEPVPDEAQDSLEVLQEAVAERVAVHCRYYSIGRDAEEEREIEPHGLFFNWGRWYCVAVPRRSHRWRVFRVDRVKQARKLTDPHAGFHPNPKFSLKDFLGRRAWALSDQPPERVTVRLAFPESRWVMAQGHGDVVEPLTDDGGAIIAFAVHDLNPFLRWLLTFRNHAQVLQPPRVAQELQALQRRVAALYAEEGGA